MFGERSNLESLRKISKRSGVLEKIKEFQDDKTFLFIADMNIFAIQIFKYLVFSSPQQNNAIVPH